MQPPADAPDLRPATAPDEAPPHTDDDPHVPAPRAQPPAAGAGGTAGAGTAGAGTAGALTEREEQILAFERKWWKHAGAKEQAVRDTFGLSSTRYYQLLNGLLDKPAALERDPVLIARLRRLRSARARTRRR